MSGRWKRRELWLLHRGYQPVCTQWGGVGRRAPGPLLGSLGRKEGNAISTSGTSGRRVTQVLGLYLVLSPGAGSPQNKQEWEV